MLATLFNQGIEGFVQKKTLSATTRIAEDQSARTLDTLLTDLFSDAHPDEQQNAPPSGHMVSPGSSGTLPLILFEWCGSS